MNLLKYKYDFFIIYMVGNIFTFVIYGMDKFFSKHEMQRVSEKKLLIFSFFTPLSALIAMHLFHHKTRKIKFMLNYLFLFIQIGSIYLFYRYMY